MKFALVENIKSQASKGLKGICISCGSEVIAKCGDVKVHHWAHKRISSCDSWWENETEWHRMWKNEFPEEWQEKAFFDKLTGEKHIADVHTAHNIVIEFQHSHIDSNERASREQFYKQMIWVVDGTRLKRDFPRIQKGLSDFKQTNQQGYFSVLFPDECFPLSWIQSKVPVIFDYKGMGNNDDPSGLRENLFCLFPIQSGQNAIVAVFKKENLINGLKEGSWFNQNRNTTQNTSRPAKQIQNKTHRRPSEFVLDRGKWKRRKRF